MSDQLIELLRDRFHGHEMDVPPGTWEQVTGQMAASSGEGLRESLQDKFQGHEVQVDPSVWANINAQIGSGAVSGTSIPTGWIAAGVAAVVITAGVFLWNNPATEKRPLVTNVPQISLNEVPVIESQPSATTAEPTVASAGATLEEQAPKAPPTEASPAPMVVAKATKEEVQQEESLTPEHAAQKNEAQNVVPYKAQHEPDMQTPVKLPITPVTVDHGSNSEPANDRASAEPAIGSIPYIRVEAKDESSQESSTSVPENDTFVWDDPFQADITSDIFIPNAITPNGDRWNEQLEIKASIEYAKVDVRVFAARSGSLVFHSNNLADMWDGTLPNGNIAEEGYYSCVVLLTDKNGETHVKSMVVKLFR